jgi:hypothetical protein
MRRFQDTSETEASREDGFFEQGRNMNAKQAILGLKQPILRQKNGKNRGLTLLIRQRK